MNGLKGFITQATSLLCILFWGAAAIADDKTEYPYRIDVTLYGHVSQNIGRQLAIGFNSNLVFDRERYRPGESTPYIFPGLVVLDVNSGELNASERRFLLQVAQDEDYRSAPFGRRTWFPDVLGAHQGPRFEQVYSVATIEGYFLSKVPQSRDGVEPEYEFLMKRPVIGLVSGGAELVDFEEPVFFVTGVRYLGQLKSGWLGFGEYRIRDVLGSRSLFPGNHPN